jgi:predicted murein hydrolase (TIGR00659 family)
MPQTIVIPPWNEPREIFDALNGSTPFFGIALTFAVYYASARLHRAIGTPVFLHPLLIAIATIAIVLELTGVPYDSYYQSAEALHVLLGPVIVLLAVPLWRQMATIRETGVGLVFVLLAGSITGVATSVGVALALSAPDQLISTLAPRSVTTPVAINLSESLGGVPAITALLVILTGLVGATVGWPLLKGLGFRDPRAKGFAIGIAAHVIGTARVLQINQQAGAFASLGMILNALMTTLILGLAQLIIV